LRRAVSRLPAAKLPIAASGWSTCLLLVTLFAGPIPDERPRR
jgi:hypothetical protein